MKNTLLTCLLTVCYFVMFGQTLTQNINNRLIQKKDLHHKVFSLSPGDFDFSPLFIKTDNSVIYGFIGDNYQRIRIKFLMLTKNASFPDQYSVYGKSMVKNNICEFKGTLTISNIMKYKTISYGVDDKYKNKGITGQYVIVGSYVLSENETQAHSGTFKGVFQSNFYLDKSNKVIYDDIDNISDGYTNNQFIGKWISYKGNITKRCNWGDFRIPNSGDLDMGADEFSPSEKYFKFGWQTVNAQYGHDKKAKEIEYAKWWQ